MTRPTFVRLRQAHKPLPKWWRPKLNGAGAQHVRLVHWDLFTRFVDGTATADDARDWAETCLTYTRMVQLLQADGTEFTTEAVAALRRAADDGGDMLRRLQRTGSAAFTGPQLVAGREAIVLMDELLSLDRNGIALRAAVEISAESRRAVVRGLENPSPQPRPQGH